MRDRAKMVSDQFKAGVTNFCQGLASTKLQLDPISGEGLRASPRRGRGGPVKNSKYGESWIRSRHFTSLSDIDIQYHDRFCLPLSMILPPWLPVQCLNASTLNPLPTSHRCF